MSIAYDIDHVTWNIQQGGYDKRHVFDQGEDCDPEREAAISQTIKNLGVAGVESLSLIDTYGWQKHYGNNDAIAKHLGMQHAYFQPLNNTRVDRIYGPGAGNVYATNNQLELVRELDLHDRSGILAVEKIGKKTVQVASIYSTDINTEPDLQRLEMQAALSNLEPDVDYTIINGDFNSPDPDMQAASLRSKRDDLIIRTAGSFSMFIPAERMFLSEKVPRVINTLGYYGLLARTYNRRTVIPELKNRGYTDADPTNQPTASLAGIHVAVDKIFHNGDFELTRHDVMEPRQKASDHFPVRFQAKFRAPQQA